MDLDLGGKHVLIGGGSKGIGLACASAFLGEIWRGCIQSVHKSQWEAAECIGLTRWQRMVKVVLPQALRIATPPTVGFMVQIIKTTSVASLVIGFADTFGKVLVPELSGMVVYLVMAAVLLWRPEGIFKKG